MSDDIKLPPLPVGFFKHRIAGFDGPVYAEIQMEDYARAAVEADRQGRMPSDEEIDKLSHGFALQYQDHVRGFASALLSRYSSGQPAAVRCNHCGWRGADADLVRDIAADEPDDGAADVCPRCKRIGDLQDSGQPSASAEHQQLREFYDVLTDDELIVAQQHHIEKLQARLPGRVPFPGRVREG